MHSCGGRNAYNDDANSSEGDCKINNVVSCFKFIDFPNNLMMAIAARENI